MNISRLSPQLSMKSISIIAVSILVTSQIGWGRSQVEARASNLGDPNPTIHVNPIGHWAQGFDWAEGTTIHLTIERPATPNYEADTVVGPADWNPSVILANFNLWDPQYDLQAGDVVTMSDGITPRSMTVTALRVTVVDAVTDTVSGTAHAADGDVYVSVDGGPNLNVTVDPGGNWTANFSSYDLIPGMRGFAMQQDLNGNFTQDDWRALRPWIRANVNGRWVQAQEWPLGANLTMNVNGGSDHTATVKSNPSNPGDLFNTFAQFDNIILNFGDLISITDGTNAKSYKVTELQVTGLDVDADTVSGVATPGAQVQVCANLPSTCISRVVTADNSMGAWVADYSGSFDLKPGSSGWASEGNAVGDSTWVDWFVPNPHIEVFPAIHLAKAIYWPVGSSIHMTIERLATPTYEADAVVEQSPWDPSYTVAYFSLQNPHYDLQNDDVVTMSGNSATRSMSVTALQVTSVDVVAETVSGTADITDGEVYVWINGGPDRHVAVGAGGNWTADFSPYDIQPGTNGGAQQVDSNDNSTNFDWNVPNPKFTVRANEDRVEAYDWKLGTEVTLAIDDPGTPANPDYTTTQIVDVLPKDPNQTYAEFNLKGVFDIKPGFHISLSVGTTTKAHYVTNLAVTGVDVDMDLVNGTAYPATRVDVVACDPKSCPSSRHVTAYGDGNWTADFAHPGAQGDEQNLLDIVPGSNGDSSQCDSDGDCTAFSWRVPDPRFLVRTNEDRVEAYDWKLGQTVTLKIDDPGTPTNPDYTTTRIVEVQPKDPGQTFATFDLKGIFDIQPGFYVTLSDGATTKSHYVTNLAITGVDLDKDLVNGVAYPATNVDVWACDDKNCYNRHLTADGDGNWTADFAHPGTQGDEQNTFDIGPGSWIDSGQCDADGDCTQFGTNIPRPQFNVRANEDRVEANQWTLGKTVTLTIDDPETGNNPDYMDTRIIGVAPWDASQTYAEFNLQGVFDIQPGFMVSLSDGTTTKTHTVTNLAIAGYDLVLDTMTGVAAADSKVDLKACDDKNCSDRHVTADGTDTWRADFAHPGTEGDEQNTFDIKLGTKVDSGQCDEDGDCTNFGMLIPNPSFGVRANEDRVEAYEWKLGDTVTLEIDDPGTAKNPDYTGTQIVDVMPWDASQTYANFSLNGTFDILPGFLVSLSDGTTAKTHTVTGLEVSSVDPDKDLVNGMAETGMRVDVWACDSSNCYNRHATVEGTGKWTVDFAHPGTEGNEQNTFNIVPGTWGDSKQCDDDGDCTYFSWHVPNPNVNVRANEDLVDANEWKLGDTVTLKIYKPGSTDPDYTDNKTVGVNPKDPNQTYAEFNLNGVFDIQPGFLVTLSDGTKTKTHTVTSLAITEYDLVLDTVSGIAAAGLHLDVWACDGKNCYYRHLIADGDGKWTADYAHPGTQKDEQNTLDITPGTWIDSSQCDEDGDCTNFGLNIPNPNLGVRANDEQVIANEWTLGQTVTLKIYKIGSVNPDYTSARIIGVSPKDPKQTYAEFNLKGVFDIQPGFKISLSDGTTTKIHTVKGLAITAYSLALDSITGIAEAGSYVDLWACDDKNCYPRHVTADGAGKWTADFAHKGTQGDEQDIFDIVPGTWIDSSLCDEDGDCTLFGLTVSYSTIFLPLVIRK